jgi:hypothetical protein
VRRAAALVLVTLLSGCGGSHADNVVSQTANKLDEIRSGDLTLRLVVSPRTGTKGRIGFELRGPFALRPGGLPVAKIVYTQIAGARQATATFISTGTKAYAEVNGTAYELPASSTNALRSAGGRTGKSSGLGQFDIGSWVKDPVVKNGGMVGGTHTDRVSADLDVVATANGLLGFVRQLGRNAPTIEGDQAKKLRQAVDSSKFELWTGKTDHLLRRLLIQADLGFGVPVSLRKVLGKVVGAKVDFELSVSRPNRSVSVAPPTNPRPASELPGSG